MFTACEIKSAKHPSPFHPLFFFSLQTPDIIIIMSSSSSSSSLTDKIIVGAATVVLSFLAYNTLRRRRSPSSVATTTGSSSRSDHHDDREYRYGGRHCTPEERERLEKALRAMRCKDLIACLDALDDTIARFPGSFDAHLLRARCKALAQDMSPSLDEHQGDRLNVALTTHASSAAAAAAGVVGDRIDRWADLHTAERLATNAAQLAIVHAELKVGHLQDADLRIGLLEECIEEIDRVVASDGKWAQCDYLLLERVKLYVDCITSLSLEDHTYDTGDSVRVMAQYDSLQRRDDDSIARYVAKVIADCDKVIQHSESNVFLADAHFFRATFMEMGSPDQLVCISRCIAKLPEFVDALTMRAQLYFSEFNDIPRALSDFERVLKLEPNNVDALFLKALCLFKQGSQVQDLSNASASWLDKVVSIVERVLMLQPDHMDARQLRDESRVLEAKLDQHRERNEG